MMMIRKKDEKIDENIQSSIGIKTQKELTDEKRKTNYHDNISR